MPCSQFYCVDIITAEGPAEILPARSGAVLGLWQGARILKITQSELLELATKRSSSPPSPELVGMRNPELETYFRPLVLRGERKRIREDLDNMILRLDEDLWRLKLIVEWSGAPRLKHSRSFSEQAVTVMGMAKSAIASAAVLLNDSAAADENPRDADGNSSDGVEQR
jgi:hypothetical protein